MKCWAAAAVGFVLICVSALAGFFVHDYIVSANLFKKPQTQNSSQLEISSQIESKQEPSPAEPPLVTVPSAATGDQPGATEYLKGISTKLRIDSLGSRLREPEKRQIPNYPYIIALTGGIAAGKSTISQHLKTLGASVVDCDKLAHAVYKRGTQCYHAIVAHFGYEILSENEEIDRRKLGAIVFANTTKLNELNEIVWPSIGFQVQHVIETTRREKTSDVVVFEAAVLLKAGWQDKMHEVWSVVIPRETAIERIVKRNNLTKAQAIQRIDSQSTNDEMVDASTVVFSTQWSDEYTRQQVEKAWNELKNYLKTFKSKP